MWKSYLFPKFPKVGDTPPTLEDIERGKPNWAMWIWGCAFFLTAPIWVMTFMGYPHNHFNAVAFLAAFVFEMLFCSFYLLAGMRAIPYEAVNEACRSEKWDCSKVENFFRENPEFSAYREAVLQQGRPFYVGEMNTLLQQSREMKKVNACKSLYKLNG